MAGSTQLTLDKAADCGPLSLAAISGDEHAVSDLLARFPSVCDEINVFGETPIHLAVLNPTCLRFIVAKSERSVLNWYNIDGCQALHYASRMRCEESVAILLQHGSDLTAACFWKTNTSCATLLAGELKRRRDGLKALAVRHLPGLEIARLGLGNDNTLDHKAREVQQLLLDRDVVLPDELDTYRNIPSISTCPTVFHYYPQNIERYDMFWDHGFRDIDAPDEEGCTPLLLAAQDDAFDRVNWLIEHGADFRTPFPAAASNHLQPPLTPAHFLLGCIRNRWGNDSFDDLQSVRVVVKKLLPIHANDDCSCHCTSGGCTPLTWFVKNLARWTSDGPRRRFDNPQDLANLLVRFIRDVEPSFTMDQHLAVVKLMTHEVMDITHTCCRSIRWGKLYLKPLSADEAEEIDAEQTHLLDILDCLVAEFKQISIEERDGQPLGLADPEEFWTRRWVSRMDVALQELDSDDLAEQERADANAIGVVWDDAVSDASSEASIDNDRSVWDTPEYFRWEIDNIMREYR